MFLCVFGQDVTDLFGTDLPVEGGKGGEFAWRDGPLLAALKKGHWVVLDEVNISHFSIEQYTVHWSSCFCEVKKVEKKKYIYISLSCCQLNLASQSVLEGLNACFDHRAEIYIPELSMSFQVQHKQTKIFGCQNPFTQGGGRKGLPKSFLNRFTQVSSILKCKGTCILSNIYVSSQFTDHSVSLSNVMFAGVCGPAHQQRHGVHCRLYFPQHQQGNYC